MWCETTRLYLSQNWKRRGIHRNGAGFTKKRGIGRRVLGDVGRVLVIWSVLVLVLECHFRGRVDLPTRKMPSLVLLKSQSYVRFI